MGLLAAVGHPHRCACGTTWIHKTWGCVSAEERECPQCEEKRVGKKPD